MPRDRSDLTVVELKERLKTHGLSTAGSKAELISRLHEVDPSVSWAENDGSGDVEDVGGVEDGELESLSRREFELCRREKELAERELDLARREVLMMREQLTRCRSPADDAATATATGAAMSFDDGGMSRVPPRASLTAIADLLGDFDGTSNNFETWEKQL
ncbi:PREDICTED: uncharacterized protein C31H12.03c-like, partial [Vollenhovia emeryi]|uniref:uncharacterized protein C31H12.03c-like n=1 Tax=Vollenhovia emeryi TaxID=411798 RepID=UPI0005F58B1D